MCWNSIQLSALAHNYVISSFKAFFMHLHVHVSFTCSLKNVLQIIHINIRQQIKPQLSLKFLHAISSRVEYLILLHVRYGIRKGNTQRAMKKFG